MIIGLDLGKKIGLAYAAQDINMAIPYCVVSSIEGAVNKIQEKDGKFLVVGWPLLLSGEEGEQCRTVQTMLDKLLQTCNLPYFLQDERFSSRFVNTNVMRNKDKGQDQRLMHEEHMHSAAWILQTYLDNKKNF